MTDRISFLAGCAVIGISLLIASTIIARAIKNTGDDNNPAQVGRYQFQVSTPPGSLWRIDTTTGVVKAQNSEFPFDEK